MDERQRERTVSLGVPLDQAIDGFDRMVDLDVSDSCIRRSCHRPIDRSIDGFSITEHENEERSMTSEHRAPFLPRPRDLPRVHLFESCEARR